MIFDKNEKRIKALQSQLTKGLGVPDKIKSKIEKLRERGPEYWIRYTVKGKLQDEKCPQKYQYSRTDAEQYYKIVTGEAVQDKHILPAVRRTTIAIMVEFFLTEKEKKVKRKGKLGNYNAVKSLSKVMITLIGNLTFDECKENPSLLQDHIDDLHSLCPDWSDKTIWNYYKELKAVFSTWIKKKLLQVPNPMNAVDEPEQNINTIDYVPTPEDYERIVATGLIEGVRGDVLRLIGTARYLGLRIEEILNIKIEDCVLDPDDGGLPYVWVDILKQKRKTRVPRPIRRELRDILREQIAYQRSVNPQETRVWPWVDPPYRLFIVYELVKGIAKDGKCRLMRKEKGHLYELAGVKVPRPFHDYRKSVRLELKRNPNLSREQAKSYQCHQTDSMDDYYTFFQREDLETAVRDSYKDERLNLKKDPDSEEKGISE
jgi:integrase